MGVRAAIRDFESENLNFIYNLALDQYIPITSINANYKFNDRLNLISGFEFRNSHVQGDYVIGTTDNPTEEGFAPVMPGGNHFYKKENIINLL